MVTVPVSPRLVEPRICLLPVPARCFAFPLSERDCDRTEEDVDVVAVEAGPKRDSIEKRRERVKRVLFLWFLLFLLTSTTTE